MPIAERSIAAGAVTLSWYKVTKDQVCRNASLQHKPLPHKPGRTTDCNYFAPLCSLIILRFSKNLLCPCNRTGLHCSARFRPRLFCWWEE